MSCGSKCLFSTVVAERVRAQATLDEGLCLLLVPRLVACGCCSCVGLWEGKEKPLVWRAGEPALGGTGWEGETHHPRLTLSVVYLLLLLQVNA